MRYFNADGRSYLGGDGSLFSSSIFEERKSGLTIRLNLSGSALSNSCLKRSSLARCFALIGFRSFDFFRGTPKA